MKKGFYLLIVFSLLVTNIIIGTFIEQTVYAEEINENEIDNTNEIKKINYTSQIESNDLIIKNLFAKLVSDELEFTLEYESNFIRNVSFFNPPNGNNLKVIINDGIDPNKNEIKFNIKVKELLDIDKITMKFYKDNVNELNFIFLNIDDLKTMLESINLEDILENDKLPQQILDNSTLTYDINNDNNIDLLDLTKLLSFYNTNNNDENFKTKFDFNKDNIIDIFDLVILAKKI